MKVRGHTKARRPYRQMARAQAAADTARRILEAFSEYAHDHWFDEITLDEVARRAGVTVRSVIRRFGGKEGLIKAMVEQMGPQFSAEFTAAPGDVDSAIGRLFTVYERYGDGVIRNLAQEPRVPALQPLIDLGRKEHRRITAEEFGPWLEQLRESERREALDALVIATDIYVWKLLRRDMGRSVAASRTALKRLVNAILVEYTQRSTT